MHQQALNQAIGTTLPGGRLHDDFEVLGGNFGEWIWQQGVEANKDVYIENFRNIQRFGAPTTAAFATEQALLEYMYAAGVPGIEYTPNPDTASPDPGTFAVVGTVPSATHPILAIGTAGAVPATWRAYVERPAQNIYVRIQLFEYMEFGANARLHGDPHHYPAPWLGPDGSSTGVTANNAARSVSSLAPGAERHDVTTWTLREWNNYSADTLLFRNYFTWFLGGQKQFMPTFNRDRQSYEADVKGDAVAHIRNDHPLGTGEVINETIRRVDNAVVRPNAAPGVGVYPAGAGTHNFFVGQTTWSAHAKFDDNGNHSVTTLPITHTAQPTLNAEVIYMADWYAEDFSGVTATSRETFVGWILDTDGWAYWSQPLRGGEATGLLLDRIQLTGDPEDTWYYAIHIESEMATARYARATFEHDWTSRGEYLVNWLVNYTPDTGAGGATLTIPGVGGTFTYNDVEWRVLYEDGAGNRLIITEQVHMPGTPYNLTNVYTRLGESHARTVLNNWWGPNVTGELRAAAVPALNVENDVRYTDWHLGWWEEQGPDGMSAPGTGTVAENGSNALFILSISEVNTYFADDAARVTNYHWWTRSSGIPLDAHVTIVVGHQGVIGAQPADAVEMLFIYEGALILANGLRPALWINV